MDKGKLRLQEKLNAHKDLFCNYCGTEVIKTGDKLRAFARYGKSFCNHTCSILAQDISRLHTKENALKVSKTTKGVSRPKSSYYMKLRFQNGTHPMQISEIKKRIIASMQGKTFLSRGGNGQFTKQQIKLMEALRTTIHGDECIYELPILTASVRGLLPSLPPFYAPDIGIKKYKIAIEVDGHSHTLKKQRFIDYRKTTILKALGWQILRFWNKEVDENLDDCVNKILESIIFR